MVLYVFAVTRAEAKFRGTEYYNRVCKWHGEEEADWTFDTQDVGANGDGEFYIL